MCFQITSNTAPRQRTCYKVVAVTGHRGEWDSPMRGNFGRPPYKAGAVVRAAGPIVQKVGQSARAGIYVYLRASAAHKDRRGWGWGGRGFAVIRLRVDPADFIARGLRYLGKPGERGQAVAIYRSVQVVGRV